MQLSPRDWSRYLRIVETSVVIGVSEWVPLVPENLDRVVLLLGYSQTMSGIFVTTNPVNDTFGNAIGGMALVTGSGTGGATILNLSHELHGKLVQMAWYVAGSGSTATAIEMIMDQPPPGAYTDRPSMLKGNTFVPPPR